MRVQETVCVAEDLQIHPPERRVQASASPLDRLAKPLHVRQESHPLAPRQIRQSLDTELISKEHAIAGQELRIPDHREAGL